MWLRPYKSCDAERIAQWCRDEETFRNWSGGRFGGYPITPERIDEKYRALNGDCSEPDNFYPLAACEDSGAVGSLIIRYLNGNPRILRFGWVIVDGGKRGKGYGRQMLTLALQYAFGILKEEKVTIGVYAHNLPAYHCYRSVGFREVGETYDEQLKIIELEITREAYLQK